RLPISTRECRLRSASRTTSQCREQLSMRAGRSTGEKRSRAQSVPAPSFRSEFEPIGPSFLAARTDDSSCKPLSNIARERMAEGTERTRRIGESLKQMMKDNNFEGEALGVDQVDSAVILSMIEAGLKVVPARPIVELARSVKTADEVEIYRAIGRQYEYTFNT